METAVIFSYTAPASGLPAAAIRRDTWQHNFAPRFGADAVENLRRCIKTHRPDWDISIQNAAPWE